MFPNGHAVVPEGKPCCQEHALTFETQAPQSPLFKVKITGSDHLLSFLPVFKATTLDWYLSLKAFLTSTQARLSIFYTKAMVHLVLEVLPVATYTVQSA